MSQINDPWSKWGAFSEEQLAADDAKVGALAGGQFMQLQVGENVVRILPGHPDRPLKNGKVSPFRSTAVHYVEAIHGLDQKVVFNCPRIELRERCIVCLRVEQLQRSGNPIDRQMAQKIAPGLRVMCNVVDRKAPEAGVRVLAFGVSIWNQLKDIRKSARLGGDFTQVGPQGFDIIIVRVGTGQTDTEYTVHADRSPSPLAATPEEVDEIMEQAKDLEAVVDTQPPERLLKAWSDLALASHEARPALQAVRGQDQPALGQGLGSRVMASQPGASRLPSRMAAQDAMLDPDDIDAEFPPK